jgi:pimeloyl-ACP methyl ester carboxylesterase
MAARGTPASAATTGSSLRALAERGVLAIVADYRLYPEVRFPEFLRDAALALAWGLENGKRLGGDPRRTFVMGHSAGGYNAAMLALDPRWLAPTGHDAKRELAGWIGLAGPYEFLPLKPGPRRRSRRAPAASLAGVAPRAKQR